MIYNKIKTKMEYIKSFEDFLNESELNEALDFKALGYSSKKELDDRITELAKEMHKETGMPIAACKKEQIRTFEDELNQKKYKKNEAEVTEAEVANSPSTLRTRLQKYEYQLKNWNPEKEEIAAKKRSSSAKSKKAWIEGRIKELKDQIKNKKTNESFICSFEEFINETKMNEGHDGEIGATQAQTKDAAIKELEDMIKSSKEDDGDLKKFRGVKWVGNTTEDKLDKLSMQYEDQYIVAGTVDGEIWMARSRRS